VVGVGGGGIDSHIKGVAFLILAANGSQFCMLFFQAKFHINFNSLCSDSGKNYTVPHKFLCCICKIKTFWGNSACMQEKCVRRGFFCYKIRVFYRS
jgi:hypothetical protein